VQGWRLFERIGDGRRAFRKEVASVSTHKILSAALVFALASSSSAVAQPFVQIADVNTEISSFGWSASYDDRTAVAVGDELFFIAEDSMSGREIWKSDGTDAGTVQVKDLFPGERGSGPRALTVAEGILYFVADDGVHGEELWRTDSTEAGTWLVRDIGPGSADGVIGPLMAAGGNLFFAADDGLAGQELWTSDGTAAGTRLVQDIRPGSEGSSARPRAASPGRLLFSADDGVHGTEPWVSDGTPSGTHLLIDLRPGADSSTGSFATEEWFVGSDGLLLFTAFGGTGLSGLWASRGTAADTVLLGGFPQISSSAGSFVELGAGVCFATVSQLWRTDGTPAGTALLKQLQPGPRNLVRLGDRVVFSAGEPGGAQGRELWSTDGTAAGTQLVKDVRPGPAGGLSDRAATLVAGEGEVLFLATVDVADGGGTHPAAQLWRSDGTAAGTGAAVDLGPELTLESLPAGSLDPVGPLIGAADRLYLWVYSSSFLQLWRSDATPAGTRPLLVPRLTDSNPNTAAPGRRGNRLLFAANDGRSGLEPWVTDGTPEGLRQLADTVPGAGSSLARIEPGQPLGGLTWFLANDRLWKTDGSPEGTEILDLGGVGGLAELTRFDDALFFAGKDPVLGRALFRSDGTLGGTVLLVDPLPGPPVPVPVTPNTHAILDGIVYSLTPLRDALFFAGGTGDSANRMRVSLWKSDGTAAGTGAIPSAIQPSQPSDLTAVGRQLFFFAARPEAGLELWRSDGTAGGTAMVKDIRPGPRSGPSSGLLALGQTVFFGADDGSSGRELWRSDGKEKGTVLVRDIAPGAAGSDPSLRARFQGRVFFSADDGVHGAELWVSDGTPGGTYLVKDIHPGAAPSWPYFYLDLGTRLLFAADDGIHGREVWQTDGTEAGTVLVQDLAPGSLSSDPGGLVTAGAWIYFSADDGVSGRELWGAPRAWLGPAFADVPPGFWAWRWVESLAYSGIAAGCGLGDFCPERPVTRAEGAVFLVQASHESGIAPPPATGTRFGDVPLSHWAADWIERLAADGVTAGCGGGNFCPDRPLSRAELAVLLLRARHGPAFLPAPATGALFTDVPADHWAAAWIEQLAAEGLTGGCAPGLFCPDRPLSRAELAVFLVDGFGLP
jgi:ELWxxDGT repeat protein